MSECHHRGDKTPEYVNHLETLSQIPRLHCVIIYRDCRDVVSSYLKRVPIWRNQEFQAHTVEEVVERWVHAVEVMEKYRDRIHVIRYESLVQEPVQELESLGRLLQIDPGGFPAKMIQADRIGKHKNHLTDAEVSNLMKIAGPAMVRLGYV